MKPGITTFLALCAVAVAAFLAPPTRGAEDGLPGVKGTIYRIEKDRNNAATADRVTVKVGDRIEIDWTYPVVPGAFPTGAAAKVEGEAVKFTEAVRIVRPRLVGAGRIAAFFKAEKEGKATLVWTISTKNGDVTLKCEVEVKK